MNDLGKMMVIAGLLLAIACAFVWSGVGRSWLGRLPGDINYKGNNFSFHFPIITCLLVSIILTVILRLFRK